MATATHVRRSGITGLDLKLRRVAAGVTQTELAGHLGITRQAVGNVEARAHVSGRICERYLDALAGVAEQ
jgi:DNA-binding XRE family transcriptional regulator